MVKAVRLYSRIYGSGALSSLFTCSWLRTHLPRTSVTETPIFFANITYLNCSPVFVCFYYLFQTFFANPLALGRVRYRSILSHLN